MPHETRSAITKTTKKTNNNNNKKSKNKNFTAKTQYLNLKAPSNNVKLQKKTLTTQIYFFLTTRQMRFFE